MGVFSRQADGETQIKPPIIARTRERTLGRARASIYDGYYEAGFGTLPNPIRVHCEIGLIAACTPVIDRYTRLENALGTRFLKVRSDTDPIKATEKALENAEQSERMRINLRGAVTNFIKYLRENEVFVNPPRLSKEQKQEIIKLASYVARMRASVWARYDRYGDLITLEAINEEKPTRVAKQLMKLAMLLAIIRGHSTIEEEELYTLRRVARDTAEPTRQKILDTFQSYGNWNVRLAINDIDGITKKQGKRIHYRTAKNELEIMDTLGIVDRDDAGNYQVSNDFHDLADYVYTPLPGVTSEKEADLGLFSEATRVEGTSTLAEDLDVLCKTLHHIQENEAHGPVTHNTLRERLEWEQDRYDKIMEVAKRDRMVYEPRVGFVGVSW